MNNVSILAAFVAGVFSISSPCVLPLIPIYLTHISGLSAGENKRNVRGVVMINAIAYVLGFSLVFIATGAALGAAGQFAGSLDFINRNRDWLVKLGGLLLVILGLHQVGVFRIPFLYREAHVHLDGGKPGTIGSSFVIGLSFGAGWSPCMGPIIGAILTMAASQANTGRAILLLAVYSLGLGIPFLLAAMAFGTLPAILKRVNRHLEMVSIVSGAIMILIGIVMVLGIYEQLMNEIIRVAPWTPFEPKLNS